MSGSPDLSFAAALALLPGMGPAGLSDLLRRYQPAEAWSCVGQGAERRPPPPPPRPGDPRRHSPMARTEWADAVDRLDVDANWQAIQAAGIGVTYLGHERYPASLRDDPEPPGVLFWAGDLEILNRTCVAIVGSRRGTGYGRDVAHAIALGLVRAGVVVVSGLALGIDGSAHAGALADPAGTTVGVAASGVDVPYPRRHARLWSDVTARGVIISETPPGRPAQAWRFPARNRVIAALAKKVVVVESHEGGGSMLTVHAADKRDVDVLVVPGPVTSPASAGTNELLRTGCTPVRHARDVLDELGDFRSWDDGQGRFEIRAPRPAKLDALGRQVMAAVDSTPTSVAKMVERTGLAPAALSAAAMKLEALGLIRGQPGWWERTPP